LFTAERTKRFLARKAQRIEIHPLVEVKTESESLSVAMIENQENPSKEMTEGEMIDLTKLKTESESLSVAMIGNQENPSKEMTEGEMIDLTKLKTESESLSVAMIGNQENPSKEMTEGGNDRFDKDENRERRPFSSDDRKPREPFQRDDRRGNDRFDKDENRERKPFSSDDRKPREPFQRDDRRGNDRFDKDERKEHSKKSSGKDGLFLERRDVSAPKKTSRGRANHDEESVMRLNKFLAHSGVASRRNCTEIIKNGEIQVNGKTESNPAYEIQEGDVVKYHNKVVKPETKMVYLLLNKPKNVITTVSDEKGRKTVLDLVEAKVEGRVYPVGRLDRNTTGLLLITNDGELAEKLSHPSYEVSKVYQVELDKNLSESDMDKIRKGISLEDGEVEVDGINYFNDKKRNEIGIEIHSGKNRIVRRIFEHLGYEVVKLDRIQYAGLTKKDLPRGWSRPLTKKEIIMLKHFK
jgi:23S rRNA pseudouridine2605 synthase